MAKTKIQNEVQEKANKIIADFNKSTFKKNEEIEYFAKYKGDFLYINRMERQTDSPIARLKYKGKFDNWEFAIYKYSRSGYDPNEWFFPGAEFVNGTIEGALKASHNAYPPTYVPSDSELISFLGQFLGKKNFKI